MAGCVLDTSSLLDPTHFDKNHDKLREPQISNLRQIGSKSKFALTANSSFVLCQLPRMMANPPASRSDIQENIFGLYMPFWCRHQRSRFPFDFTNWKKENLKKALKVRLERVRQKVIQFHFTTIQFYAWLSATVFIEELKIFKR